MPAELECPFCTKRLSLPESALGKRIRCPACKSVIDTASQAPPETSGDEPVQFLPEKMAATAQIAGRACPSCRATLATGDPVHNCPLCGTSHHESCWSGQGGCSVKDCGRAHPATSPPPLGMEQGPAGASKSCPFCNTQIPADARKCPSCREWIEPRPVGDTSAPVPAVQTTPTSAVVALVLGILSVVICPPIGIGAIIAGFKGIAETRESDSGGYGMAMAGVILGFASVGLTVLIFLIFIISASSGM